MASEMLYPVMPLYLKSIGFTTIWIGILEGVAEATAGLSKGYFGKQSDVSGRRIPFIQLGYFLSALSKPLMACSIAPLWVFLVRTTDRLGKGIRTGARDAMLSSESKPEHKGRIFGFHRSMDTLGAFLGPCIALLYLYLHPLEYKNLFLLAFIPGVLAICASLLLRDKTHNSLPGDTTESRLAFLKYWKKSPLEYRKLVMGLLIFSLFNSSDLFLLLKLKTSGIDDVHVIGAYIFYNLVYAVFAFPIGILADRIGMKLTLVSGLILYSICYFGMSYTSEVPLVFGLFFVYGIYAAATEGISKAWISHVTDKKDIATAIGNFAGLQSICTLIASSMMGFIWYYLGPEFAFGLSGAISLLVALYISKLLNPLSR